ncbi:hypothetical protein GOP47_0026399 [Adiantum capillus-veneris]|nr:hypothetical protein GOP47_0026399 [Adiantum capillus-veneris]
MSALVSPAVNGRDYMQAFLCIPPTATPPSSSFTLQRHECTSSVASSEVIATDQALHDPQVRTITLFGSRLTLAPPPAHHHMIQHHEPYDPRHTNKLLPKFEGTTGRTKASANETIKVGMDGVPFVRKVSLTNLQGYQDLALHLDKLFQFEKNKLQSILAILCEKPRQLSLKELQNVHCILTYKDNDGDWMLVGDTPWELFIQSARRLHIIKQ